jgi:hypothetical protein
MAMTRTGPASWSVYRGQSRRGIGEGPESPILHGEQYLSASPEIAKDADLLEAIRPWMSLDSDPEDHRRLGDRLEAWSCFRYRGLRFVVRLVSAGIYDRRAAYFSHGRAWPVEAGGPGFDPGLLLGRSEAFESPWRDDDPGQRVPEPFPALVRPEQIAAEPETARLFLAHFLQSCARQRPLIVACPVAEFAAGAPLHALVSLARGALPADFRLQSRIRVYTRTPELFLREPGAALIVVPDEIAGRALGARREATLIDRRGKALAGEALEATALAYAEAVIERVLRIPDGLTLFTERFRDHRSRPGLPEEREVRAIQVTYNLAVALAGSPEERGDLLRSYLPRIANKLGADLDWLRLITPDDWQAFPREAVLDHLLMDSQSLSGGFRELQKAVEQSAAQLRWTVDARLPKWWDAGEAWKLRRLIELASQQPPLVSPRATAEWTVPLPIRQIAALGPAEPVLAAELASGVLSRRGGESEDLGELAASPGVLQILLQATANGALGPDWARAFLQKADGQRLSELFSEALGVSHFFHRDGPWQEVPVLLLDRLRRLALPREWARVILEAGLAVSPADNLPVYLRLADLLARMDERSGLVGEGGLTARLWQELPWLEEAEDRELLMQAAFSRDWRCLQPSSLADPQGQLRQLWMEAMAPRLVEHEDLLQALNVLTLLRLAGHLEDPNDLERIFDYVDAHLSRNLQPTTDTLIREGWWGAWRRDSRLALQPARAKQAAEAWLTSRSWINDEREAALEEWKQVMRDLPDDLSAASLKALWVDGAPRRHWPWIPPFEEDQIRDLGEKGADLIALADLAEALHADSAYLKLGDEPVHRYVLRCSRFKGKQHQDALGWLLPPGLFQGKPPVLDLKSALLLVKSAGPRVDRAHQALLASVLQCLKDDNQAPDAIRQAGEVPGFWRSPEALAALATWMVQRGSVESITKDLLALINDRIAGEPASYPKKEQKNLVKQLTKQGYKKAARLLSPDLAWEAEAETLVQSVLEAMTEGSRGHACWKELALALTPAAPSGDDGSRPLSSLAAEIRQLPRERRRALGKHGWSTFEAAACDYPKLMGALPGEPASLPVFDLAASLSEPGGLGMAALQVVLSPASNTYRTQKDWWEALLHGLSTWRRYSASTDCPEDRRDVAVALLMQLTESLASGERQVFWAALKRREEKFSESEPL